MTNSTIPGKRSYFKVLLNIIVIVVVSAICFNLLKTNIAKVDSEKQKIEQLQKKQEELLDTYKYKIDSLSEVNKELGKEQITIAYKLDSITKVQKNISIAYEKEVNNINNATLSDHAEWFFSEIDKAKESRILTSN